jgi:hypothetical protein
VHPVQACPDSHITGGRLGDMTASAILGASSIGNAMPVAMTVQNFIKSRRDTPGSFSLISLKWVVSKLLVSKSCLFMLPSPAK